MPFSRFAAGKRSPGASSCGQVASPPFLGIGNPVHAVLVHETAGYLREAFLAEKGNEVLARPALVASYVDGVALTFRQRRKLFQKLLCSYLEGLLLLASGDFSKSPLLGHKAKPQSGHLLLL